MQGIAKRGRRMCVYRSTLLKSFGFHVARIHSPRRFIFIDKHMKRIRKKTSKTLRRRYGLMLHRRYVRNI